MARKTQNMIKYIIRRILYIIPTLLLVLAFTWFIARFLLVDPVLIRLGPFNPEAVEAEKQRLGYNDPLVLQLLKYFISFFTGDWGKSYILLNGRPIIEIIAEIFPKTIELVLFPTIIAPIIAVKLGIISTKYKNKSKDTFIRGFAILGVAFPVFWIALLLQIFVGRYLEFFTYGVLNFEIMGPNSSGLDYPAPSGSFRTGFRIIDSILYNNQLFLQDTLLHLILPTICMTIVSLAGITRQTRASMLEVMEQDYIRTARAKGVEEDGVLNKHALRNAMIPTSNLIIGGIAARLTGSLLIELAFNYTGMGYWMVQAIYVNDYLLINGLLVFSSVIVLSGILISDVMYTVIDPRIIYR